MTAEDHNIMGGLGGAVAEVLAQGCPVPQEFVGIRDTFGRSGEPAELAKYFGIDAASVACAVKKAIERKK